MADRGMPAQTASASRRPRPADTASTVPGPVHEEPELRRPRLVRWFSARPRLADLLVIFACTAPTVAALIFNPPVHAWFGYACAAGVAVALWWRRSHPFAVLLVSVGLAALNPVYGSAVSVGFFEGIFCLYALASRTRLRTVLAGYLLGEGIVFAVSGGAVLLGFRETLPAVLLQPAFLAAIALGVAARASRARRTALEEVVALREERAAAAERARITAEMHDVVAHSVTVMIALAGGASAGWEKHPERARKALDQLGEVGAHTLEEMQRILRVLRERDDDLARSLESSGHNLPPLRELVGVFRSAGLPVELSENAAGGEETAGAGGGAGSDPALQTTVYRIVQESLTNALRHAHDATYVEVAVARTAERLVVTVTDNGRAEPGPSIGAGVGLHAMRERAAAFDGEFEAGPVPSSETEPRAGWRTRVSLPLSSAGGIGSTPERWT